MTGVKLVGAKVELETAVASLGWEVVLELDDAEAEPLADGAEAEVPFRGAVGLGACAKMTGKAATTAIKVED